jgi:hypothetical protein
LDRSEIEIDDFISAWNDISAVFGLPVIIINEYINVRKTEGTIIKL